MTLKAADDFSAPWLVLYADTVDEAKALLAEAGNKGLGVDLGNAARGLQSTYVVAGAMPVQQVESFPTPPPAAPIQPVTQTYPAPAVPAAPQAAPQPPAVATAPPANALFCPHGQRTYKTGTGKTGAWAAHFCPLPKGHPDQCEAIWA